MAVLRELTPEACEAVRGPVILSTAQKLPAGVEPEAPLLSITGQDNAVKAEPGRSGLESATLLTRLHDLDLFTIALSDGHYRYHRLFHDFLHVQAAADPEGVRARHRRAAAYYQAHDNFEEAIYHWTTARAFDQAADAIAAAGEALLRVGRLDTLVSWIDALPPAVLAGRPRLQVYLGDVFRLRSLFDRALAWYAQAESTWRGRNDAAGISQALRGQALVYLDTVRPAQAKACYRKRCACPNGSPTARRVPGYWSYWPKTS